MGEDKEEESEVGGVLGHPCMGSFLTPPEDTTVGEICEEVLDGPIFTQTTHRTTSPMRGDVGNLSGQSAAELFGRSGWKR